MLAASSYAVRIPWCCSMQCPTSPCCLEMATVLMKGLHLRCAPRWELSIRLRHGSSTNRCNYRSNSPAAFETTPKSTSFQASLLSVPSFFRRNHSPKIIGSCANSGETKRADAVSQRHGALWDIGTQKSKKFLKNSWSTYEENYHEYTNLICLHQAPPLDFSCLHFFLPWRDLPCSSHLVGWARNGGVICKVSCLNKYRINEQMKWDMSWHLPKSWLHDLSSLMAKILLAFFACNCQISDISVQATLLALLSLHCLSLLNTGHIIATFLLQEEHCFSLFCDQTIGLGKEVPVNTISRPISMYMGNKS